MMHNKNLYSEVTAVRKSKIPNRNISQLPKIDPAPAIVVPLLEHYVVIALQESKNRFVAAIVREKTKRCAEQIGMNEINKSRKETCTLVDCYSVDSINRVKIL